MNEFVQGGEARNGDIRQLNLQREVNILVVDGETVIAMRERFQGISRSEFIVQQLRLLEETNPLLFKVILAYSDVATDRQSRDMFLEGAASVYTLLHMQSESQKP